MLEVGTGFHPELTGRENVFLNGAILGMSKEEILRKFDEIVAFAEIEKFIDNPSSVYINRGGTAFFLVSRELLGNRRKYNRSVFLSN
jgi:ABC-type Na+ transport system ATPase subunit NatA